MCAQMFKQLYKEHLTLQKAFCSLYCHFSDKNNNQNNVLDLLEEKKKMDSIVGQLETKVIQLENELRKENEKCELLEFCFLELQNQPKVSEIADSVDCAVNTDLCWTQCSLLKSHSSWQGSHPTSCCWLHVTSDDAPIVGYCCRCSLVTVMNMDQKQCQELEQSQKKLREISKKLDFMEKTDSGYIDKEWCCINEVVSSIGELQSLITWIADKKGGKEENSVIAEKLQQLGRIRKVLEKSATESQQHLHSFSKRNSLPYGQLTKEKSSFYNEHRPSEKIYEFVKRCDNNLVISDHTSIYGTKIFPMSNTMVIDQFRDLVQENEDLHDSLGTAVSEDEGLGEESRRGDSVGITSLSKMNEQSGNVNEIILDAPLQFTDPISCACNSQVEINWSGDSCQRNSVELCLAAVAKLKDSLLMKEKEIAKLKAAKTNKNEISELHLVVRNLQKNIDDLQSSICNLEKENSSLKEQVLELEEAENDARLQGQRLEEKLLFLQEKDSHFQVDFAETKHALELCLEELSLKDVEERELQSQLKFMEVLVQKYEEQIGQLESIRNDSPPELKEKCSGESEFQRSPFRIPQKSTEKVLTCDGNDVHSSPPSKDSSELSAEKVSSSLGNSVEKSLSSTHFTPKCHNLENNVILPLHSDASMQTESIHEKFASSCAQTELSVATSADGLPQLLCCSCEKTDTDDCSGSIQQELLSRLHHLVEEDAHLQQQLYQVDQINLTLWEKLHNLQFHIGECQRENMADSGIDSIGRISVASPTFSSSGINNYNAKCESEKIMPNSEILDGSGCGEERLKECLLRLEKMNASFRTKLQVREKLCTNREQKRCEWMKRDESLNAFLKAITEDKEYLLNQITQYDSEKTHFSSEVENLEIKLSNLQEKQREEIASITAQRDKILYDLQENIDNLTVREKDCLKKISKFKCEKKKVEDAEFHSLKANYVHLQLELVKYRDEFETVKHRFQVQLQSLSAKHEANEKNLVEKLEQTKEKLSVCDKNLHNQQKKYNELQDIFKSKEQELEKAKLEFENDIQIADVEKKSVESELKKILLQLEQETTFATKVLTEECIKLEKEQENLSDLRSKEEMYKARIAELESNVSQLHCELRRMTGSLHDKFDVAESTDHNLNFHQEYLLNELRELRNREVELREKLDDMEKKEAAYRETLEHADRIVATVERGYKNKIEELEMSERSLKQRIGYLEEVENCLRVALSKERRTLNGRTPDDLIAELTESEKRESSLKEELIALEQAQRNNIQRVKELEKIRNKLELQVNDREELEASLKKLQQEHECTRKELSRIKMSESSLQVALSQTECLLESREQEMKVEINQFSKEKKDLEETINQLRFQVRELKQRLEKQSLEEEPLVDMLPEDFSFSIQSSSSLEKPKCSLSTDRNPSKESLICAQHEPIVSSELHEVKPHLSSNEKYDFSDDANNSEKSCVGSSSNAEGKIPFQSGVEQTCLFEGSITEPNLGSMITSEIISSNSEFGREKQQHLKLDPLQNSETSQPIQDDSAKNKAEKEYSLARHRLEECMLRAIDAVKMEGEQKAVGLPVASESNEGTDVVLPPTDFKVLQQVSLETALVGWEYPHSSVIGGFELYVNGNLHVTVHAPDRRKAIISGLDATKPSILSICAISVGGKVSEMQTLNMPPSQNGMN